MNRMLLLLLTITLCFSETIRIPEDFGTIQEGIDIGIIIEDMEYFGSAPNMGAYEFGASSEIMAGDTNFDGIVDILDIVQIVNYILRFYS